MCISPLKIRNKSRFVDMSHRDQVYLTIPCGRCCECRKSKRNEYYYRSLHEFTACADAGGYAIFDTLTYKEPPTLNSEFGISDYSYCFRYRDIRLFLVLLRKKLERLGHNPAGSLKYFIASEFGHDDQYIDGRGRLRTGTKRPHYHLVIFNYDNSLDPVTLSNVIADSWPHGRTDGVRYRGRLRFTQHNVIRAKDSAIRVCKYVSKYVLKDLEFTDDLDKKINAVADRVVWSQVQDRLDFCQDVSYLFSFIDMKSLKRKIKRSIGEFHLQSQGFGISAIGSSFTAEDLMRSDIVSISDRDSVVMRLKLPKYYERKLFYEQIVVDGVRYWQLTDIGKKYRRLKDARLHSILVDVIRARMITYHVERNFDVDRLVDYMLHRQGRIDADEMPLTLSEKLHPDNILNCIFSYVNDNDKRVYGRRFYSTKYLGNEKIGYSSMPSADYLINIDDYTYVDQAADADLVYLLSLGSELNDQRNAVELHKQRLRDLFVN